MISFYKNDAIYYADQAKNTDNPHMECAQNNLNKFTAHLA